MIGDKTIKNRISCTNLLTKQQFISTYLTFTIQILFIIFTYSFKTLLSLKSYTK